MVHFRDVRLWSNAHLLSKKMRKIQSLLTVIDSHSLLDRNDFEALLESRVDTGLNGFPDHLDHPTFPTLHELLDENWIGDCIIDVRGHQIESLVNRRLPNDPHTLVILPTIFYVQLSNAYQDGHLSRTLKDLRESLLTAPPQFVGFVFNKDDVHWAPCLISMKKRLVQQGDSLGWLPDKTMLTKLKWFLGDLVETQGPWTETELPVPRQGSGSGSCGIVALSSIHSFVDKTAALWCPGEALRFRLDWLQQLLQHHFATIRSEAVSLVFNFEGASLLNLDEFPLFSYQGPTNLHENHCPSTPPRKIAAALTWSSPNSDFKPDDGSKSDSELSSDDSHHTPSPRSTKSYGPTVPRAQSGSPTKSADAPLDPQRPETGMFFNTLEKAVHFIYEYERRRGYMWRRAESVRKDGEFGR